MREDGWIEHGADLRGGIGGGFRGKLNRTGVAEEAQLRSGGDGRSRLQGHGKSEQNGRPHAWSFCGAGAPSEPVSEFLRLSQSFW